jgi:hypothetical protein
MSACIVLKLSNDIKPETQPPEAKQPHVMTCELCVNPKARGFSQLLLEARRHSPAQCTAVRLILAQP